MKILLKATFIFLLIFLSFMLLNQIILYKNLGKYSYTRAICNNENYCKDYVIECKNNRIISMNPTGFAVQQNENWNDNRKETDFCE